MLRSHAPQYMLKTYVLYRIHVSVPDGSEVTRIEVPVAATTRPATTQAPSYASAAHTLCAQSFPKRSKLRERVEREPCFRPTFAPRNSPERADPATHPADAAWQRSSASPSPPAVEPPVYPPSPPPGSSLPAPRTELLRRSESAPTRADSTPPRNVAVSLPTPFEAYVQLPLPPPPLARRVPPPPSVPPPVAVPLKREREVSAQQDFGTATPRCVSRRVASLTYRSRVHSQYSPRTASPSCTTA
jgi:hypothetical protein